MWGQSAQIITCLPPKRGWGSKRVITVEYNLLLDTLKAHGLSVGSGGSSVVLRACCSISYIRFNAGAVEPNASLSVHVRPPVLAAVRDYTCRRCCCSSRQFLSSVLLPSLLLVPQVCCIARRVHRFASLAHSRLIVRTRADGRLLHRFLREKHHLGHARNREIALFVVTSFRTAVPLWGQTSQILSSSSPKRDCGSTRVNQ